MASASGSESAQGLRIITPPLLYALAMLAVPLLTILAYSFFKDGYQTIIREFTLENYRAVWADPIFRTLMLRSLFVAGLVTVVTVLLAFPVAYFLSFVVRPERKSLWLFLITIPFWTSYLIRVFLWKVILGYNGVINSGLKSLGIIEQPLSFLLYNTGSIVVTLAHAYAPFAILPIYVALEKIDRSLLEAGRDLGESRAMTFWRVTLPLAMPGVLAAVLIVFIPTIGDYVTPTIIGGGKIPMVANLIQAQMLDIDNKPLGSAIAITAMLIVTLLALVFLFLNRRFLKVRA
ncbi:ABC transporter permease [Paracoccus panacisoli]|nr:ABC transporter permease [Paracoccus sanguinis]KGJ13381.1 spermidine/putrescine ABC transporter permease [Paracoccus sanguinis]KGJ17811.1 spermidine/putrescine ABC transporter permease [Paracoccus sanguinis]KGJ21307.1 spermidine/putrescine ABC transporter permease [Paracoccus sanguinis]KGJ21993.1 spermidine/putrescine ABC transporter permease [Paracoccus sanguinis]QJD15497.1 ABC transporter permease [Paracoccus sanguinis]